MKKKILVSLLAAYSVSTLAMTSDKQVMLSSNPVPLTTAVSEEFYQFSSSVPSPDVDALQINIPATKSEWLQFVESKDTAAQERALGLAEHLGTSIEKGVIAGVDVYWLTPKVVAPDMKDKLFISVQGGAYMLNSGYASITEGLVIATHLQVPVLAIDYGKAPNFPAPAGRNDIVNVWKELIQERSAESMVMGGTSAGATLSVLTVQELNKQNIEIPAALYIGTPSVDMTMTGDSRYINEGLDHVLGSWRGLAESMVEQYVGELELSDPLVSPINGSFDNFPPSYLITGTRDLLLSDTIRLDRELKRAGVATELNVYEGQSHADYLLGLGTPESTEHYQALSRFMRTYL
ncbi:alpha/beta hydrolase fold domain-containing protein [Vibrio barjaei]|jgi:acetyl esterase/lipase|uniref:alpha/beta hydrolase fold domain-containing protein n=1 Tax=Vibrio barjaei TaxID=1676683 RepID=UPI0007BC0629|nr:alpha/beta hydrolase [Vibrio barjaei]